MATDSDDRYSPRMPADSNETADSGGAGPRGVTPAPWWVHADDLIGGWAVMNVDKPPSQCDHRAGEIEVCNFAHEADARLIVMLRNTYARGWEE